VESYHKAIDIKKAIANDNDPNAAQVLAAYYNNLGDAYGESGKVDGAVRAYALMAQTNPLGAAQAYFNTGAVLTNAGRTDDALTAFDRCIATDPNRAEAYYWKGVNLLGKSTIQGDKLAAPPGTVESFQKYLELAPNGPNAQNARNTLASIGSKAKN